MQIEITIIAEVSDKETAEKYRETLASLISDPVRWRKVPETAWGVVKQVWGDFVLAVKLWWAG